MNATYYIHQAFMGHYCLLCDWCQSDMIVNGYDEEGVD